MTVDARICADFPLVEVSSGAARWSADLDPSAGGGGLPSTPHDLLDGALASCTVLTVRLYATRKKLPLG